MTCEDCIHGCVCEYNPTDLDGEEVFKLCEKGMQNKIPGMEYRCVDFKDKSRFIELPCKVGDRIYYIHKGRVNWRPITNQSIYSIATNGRLGVTCFLTREEAEKKLEEMQK